MSNQPVAEYEVARSKAKSFYPRTSGVECGGNLETAADFKHGDAIVDGNA